MRAMTKLDVLEQAQEYNVKFIRLQFTDIFGVFKNIAVTVEELPKALEGRIIFDSSAIDGKIGTREREICLLPDPATFAVFPWRPREGAVGRLICDITNPDGTPYECCSRSVLRRVADDADSMGLRMMVGAESEFFLFNQDDRNNPTVTTHDTAGYCDVSPVDLGENARRDMVMTLEEMGYEISSSHHEFAPGQHEISLKWDDALAMADKLVTFRFVVRTIAKRHSLHASFMPKPVNGLSGSGLHIYQSLFSELDNAFYDTGYNRLNETGLHYVGGLLEHAGSFAAVTNPIINSYKRMVPGTCQPCYVAWSEDNRETIVKALAHRGDETAIEVRNPDSACNPYLAIALMLKSGLEGIKNKTAPPAPANKNPDIPEADAVSGLPRMPRNLFEAVQHMKEDRLVIETLGSRLAEKYISGKETEWSRFENYVHSWEIKEYLSLL